MREVTARQDWLLALGGRFYRRWRRLIPTALARALLRRLAPADGLVTYQTDGLRIRCFRSHWAAYSMETYEPITRRVLLSCLRSGMTFVDGGANVGIYSLLAVRCVGATGRVHAFEPHPPTFQVLMTNVKENGLADRIRAWPIALADRRSEAILKISDEPGSHTLMGTASADERDVRVSCASLDELLGDEPVDVVKLDVEGAEGAALEGMSRILQRTAQPTIVLEFCSDHLQRAGREPQMLLRQLDDVGYRYWVIDEVAGVGPIPLTPLLRDHCARNPFAYTLVAMPANAPPPSTFVDS